jgi:phosphate transport system substrate-binding protein
MTMPVLGAQAQGFRERRAALAALGLLMPALAGLAWWLAAMPAAAQSKPESSAGAPPASAAPADRKQLLIVGSPLMEGLTDAVIKSLGEAYVLPPPIKQFNGLTEGIKAFCAGVGPEYPDILAATARVDRGEFETCVENKVLDVIEVDVGDSALVVVAKKGDPVFNLTPRMAYSALAEEVPSDGGFKVNEKKSWKEIDKEAPDEPIRVIVPAKGVGTRRFFDDELMQGGCRHVKEIDAIFAATERVPKCIALRDDGPVSEVPEPRILDELMKAPPGTLAVVGWLAYLENRDKLDTLPISGVAPTHENIADDSYQLIEKLFYYFKRAHMREKYGGQGFVRGVREFMIETVKDEASGEGGYLEKLGLVALEPDERRQAQNVVRRLKRFQP